MKPQSKIIVDWDRLYGEWFEVFKHFPVIDSDHIEKDTLYNRDVYSKGDGDYIDLTSAYTTKEGIDRVYPMHKIYKTGDEYNSWYKMQFTDVPGYIDFLPGWSKVLLRQLIKTNIGMNYVILNIDPEYNWLLKGEPCKKVAALLQRNGTPRLEQSVIDENMECLRRNNYKFTDEDIIWMPYPENCPSWKRI